MANQEHLRILQQGVQEWNKWRKRNNSIRPDLNGAKLYSSDLRDADLYSSDLRDANLYSANLSGADLFSADFFGADLRDANLSSAFLRDANLFNAKLSGVNLRNANLSGVNLSGVDFSSIDLRGATIEWTTFGELDLRKVRGLETIRHAGPSHLSINTIYQSEGDIPEAFVRGTGAPDSFIEYMRSLAAKPIQYYTCFISYSSKNKDFAERLYADLQSKGVRCWYAPEDMKTGDKIRHRIDTSIRLYDKLLLILSDASVASQWVEHEVETAIGKEMEGKPNVLFPVRLDDAVMQSKIGWASHIKLTRHITDFSQWKHHDAYQKAFERLLRDLKADTDF